MLIRAAQHRDVHDRDQPVQAIGLSGLSPRRLSISRSSRPVRRRRHFLFPCEFLPASAGLRRRRGGCVELAGSGSSFSTIIPSACFLRISPWRESGGESEAMKCSCTPAPTGEKSEGADGEQPQRRRFRDRRCKVQRFSAVDVGGCREIAIGVAAVGDRREIGCASVRGAGDDGPGIVGLPEDFTGVVGGVDAVDECKRQGGTSPEDNVSARRDLVETGSRRAGGVIRQHHQFAKGRFRRR